MKIKLMRCHQKDSHLLKASFGIGHCAAGSAARARGQIEVFLNQCQVVSCTQLGLEEQRGTHTAQLPMRDDGNAVAQDIGFVHVVS